MGIGVTSKEVRQSNARKKRSRKDILMTGLTVTLKEGRDDYTDYTYSTLYDFQRLQIKING